MREDLLDFWRRQLFGKARRRIYLESLDELSLGIIGTRSDDVDDAEVAMQLRDDVRRACVRRLGADREAQLEFFFGVAELRRQVVDVDRVVIELESLRVLRGAGGAPRARKRPAKSGQNEHRLR